MEEKSGAHGVWNPNGARPFLSPLPRGPSGHIWRIRGRILQDAED